MNKYEYAEQDFLIIEVLYFRLRCKYSFRSKKRTTFVIPSGKLKFNKHPILERVTDVWSNRIVVCFGL